MPRWKMATPKPGGSIPEGMLNKLMVGLGTVLVLALIISAGFCSGDSPEDAAADGETTPGSGPDGRPGRSVDRELQDVIVRQEAIIAAADRAAADAETRRLYEEEMAEAVRAADAATSARNLTPAMRQQLFDSLGVLPDPDMIEIQRQAELEALARQITSVRANPVALSFRGGSQPSPPATAGRRETVGMANPDLLNALANVGSLAGLQQQAAAAVGELEIPVPSSARLPDYENPSYLITPNDPAGWERVYEGSFLEAVLVTQLTGEFPGPVLANVSVPFYSPDRQRVLIPRGTRLVGSYQPVSRPDQAALAIGFHRLIFLDGRHVPLRFLGLDQSGSSGVSGDVNRHYLSTFLAAGAVGILSGFSLLGNPYGSIQERAAFGAGGGIGQTSDAILDRYLNRLPEITVPAGTRLRIWLTADVLLPRPPARQ